MIRWQKFDLDKLSPISWGCDNLFLASTSSKRRKKEREEITRFMDGAREQSSVIKIHGRETKVGWISKAGLTSSSSSSTLERTMVWGRGRKGREWILGMSVGCIVIYGQTCRALQIVGPSVRYQFSIHLSASFLRVSSMFEDGILWVRPCLLWIV